MGDDRAEGCSRKLASLFDDEANSGVGDARPEKAPQRGDIDNGGRKADVAAIPAADKNLYQRYTEKGGETLGADLPKPRRDNRQRT